MQVNNTKALCWRDGEVEQGSINYECCSWSHGINGTFSTFVHGSWVWRAEEVLRDDRGIVVSGRWCFTKGKTKEEWEKTRVNVRFHNADPLVLELLYAQFKERNNTVDKPDNT